MDSTDGFTRGMEVTATGSAIKMPIGDQRNLKPIYDWFKSINVGRYRLIVDPDLIEEMANFSKIQYIYPEVKTVALVNNPLFESKMRKPPTLKWKVEDYKEACDYLTSKIKKIKNSNNYFIDKEIVSCKSITNTTDLIPKKLFEWFKREHYYLYTPVLKSTDVGKYEINLFKGYKYKVKELERTKQVIKAEEDLKFILENYILRILCNKNEEIYHFLLGWIGTLIRGGKTYICLMMRGIEGIGKTSLFQLLSGVLGEDICTEQGQRVLSTDFNMPLCGQLLVNFDEYDTSNKYKASVIDSAFKRFITSDRMSYKAEYMQSVTMPNISNGMATSNQYTGKGEDGRRQFPLEISTEYCGSDIWKKIYGIFKNKTYKLFDGNYKSTFTSLDSKEKVKKIKDE
jgi:hypothetical protein